MEYRRGREQRHDGLHSRKIGTCGRHENCRGNASRRRIDSPLQIFITNSIRSILDFDSARFRTRSNSSFLSPSAYLVIIYFHPSEKGEGEREKYGAIPTAIDRRPSMKLLARFHRSRQVFHSAGSETDVEM